jgi:hypothetical protein
MFTEFRPNPQPRWLHFKAACKYLDLSHVTLALKLSNGTGPKFYRSPGSKNKIFWSLDLNDWVVNAPEHPMTEAERGRLAKLQAGAERVREERRAQRRQATKIDEEVSI